MRYESKEFIKSHRQWQESRESNRGVNGKANQLKNSIRGADNIVSLVNGSVGQQKRFPKEDVVSDSDDIDARDNVKSNQLHEGCDSYNSNPKDPPLPSDFSKRELKHLIRIRKNRTQQGTTKITSHEHCTNEIRRQSFEAILTARNNVQQSYREKRSGSSVELDSLLLPVLPKQMWFGDFFRESQDAVEKIQKRILNSRENI